ncbi:MAG: TonB-dependent receptor [Myxococcales bacterium]|nr:TonB-dependent receptor [Myxococcota bacterium]MDW8282575.1 TonB-dependent receptor [Myxococcales bacterium]
MSISMLVALVAAAAEPPPRSLVDPSYEALLPDPEPKPEPGQRERTEEVDTDLDIASRVLSAAKQVTTVQEAPSIVTVVTGDELRNRGYRTLNQALATIPGWLDVQGVGNHLSLPIVRGTAQAALLLRDGVSMFDPAFNTPQFGRPIALETIKRIEVVTGPGGVLWGANSFLGIVNVISREAEDIDGVEGGVGYGDGDGSPQDFRIWALLGKAIRLRRGPPLRIVQHISYENYLAPRQSGLLTLSRSPAPLPPGPIVFGDEVEAAPARSYILNIDGRISYGPVTLFYAYPVAEMHNSLSFGNTLAAPPLDAMGQPTAEAQPNRFTVLDRYLVLQYKSRFLRDRMGLDTKLYGIEFVRDIAAVSLPPSRLLPRGLSFAAAAHAYRVGMTLDGDTTLPLRNRLLWGGEVFHEWVPEVQVSFPQADPARLPLGCPLQPGSTYERPIYVPDCPLPFVFAASRTVLALYVSDQFRPHPRLVLDAGLRYQVGLGQRGYRGALLGGSGQLLGSASVVWNFYGDMHFKANYATGFRPPVFNNTDSNGAAVQFSGNRDLANEKSRAFQGEWNGRFLRHVGPIRELQLRADYSYTLLDSLIILSGGSYSNVRATSRNPSDTARRAIHSVEAAARLYLRDHMLSLGYTFLHIAIDDRGLMRSMPQHWVSLGAVISVLPQHLLATATLNVIGPYDDPNRMRSSSVVLPDGTLGTVALPSDLTFDRLGPQAVLHVGARGQLFRGRLWASAHVYNALNQRYDHPDVFYDLVPTLEATPTPAPGWSFFIQVGGKPW